MKKVIIIILCLFLGGCIAYAKMVKVKQSGFEARPDNYPIEIFNRAECAGNSTSYFILNSEEELFGKKLSSDSSIPQHTVIGEFYSSGMYFAPWGWLVENAKGKARKYGGDAIIIRSYGTREGSHPIGRTGGLNISVRGDIIRFISDSNQ
jgi:hypothetical protein